MEPTRPYSSPSLVVYGGVEVLTRETSSGDQLDQDFPAGTPIEIILGGGLS